MQCWALPKLERFIGITSQLLLSHIGPPACCHRHETLAYKHATYIKLSLDLHYFSVASLWSTSAPSQLKSYWNQKRTASDDRTAHSAKAKRVSLSLSHTHTHTRARARVAAVLEFLVLPYQYRATTKCSESQNWSDQHLSILIHSRVYFFDRSAATALPKRAVRRLRSEYLFARKLVLEFVTIKTFVTRFFAVFASGRHNKHTFQILKNSILTCVLDTSSLKNLRNRLSSLDYFDSESWNDRPDWIVDHIITRLLFTKEKKCTLRFSNPRP